MMRKFAVLWILSGCASPEFAATIRIDCGQEAGTAARIDGNSLAEAQRSADAGAGPDTCPDALEPSERTADRAPGLDSAEDSTLRDAAAILDGSRDSEPLDNAKDDAEQCPSPYTIPIGGNCMACGGMGFYCCRDLSCNDKGYTCNKAGLCVK